MCLGAEHVMQDVPTSGPLPLAGKVEPMCASVGHICLRDARAFSAWSTVQLDWQLLWQTKATCAHWPPLPSVKMREL